MVQGPNILDLEIEPTTKAPVPEPIVNEPFVDSAIVSYGKSSVQDVRPSHSSSFSQPSGLRPSAPPSVFSEADTGAPSVTLSAVSSKPAIPVNTKPIVAKIRIAPDRERTESLASATLTGPFSELALSDGLYAHGAVDEECDAVLDQASPRLETPSEHVGKRTRRGRRGRAAKGPMIRENRVPPNEFLDLDAVSKPLFEPLPIERALGGNTRKRNKGTGSNGWRQTPLLEDRTKLAPPNNLKQSKSQAKESMGKARSGRSNNMDSAEQRGWATEDATDIQEMGDFDFIGNLSKFDKREVFDQIRQGDATADEDRLVSINRLPYRPGTAGGKNLHHTENVLSPKVDGIVNWDSEAGTSEDDAREARISSGRSTGRNVSRASLKKPPSRKGRAMAAEQHRAGVGLVAKPAHSPHHARESPMLSSSRLSRNPKNSRKPSLLLVASGSPCPCLSPLQMLELEQLAISELDLSEDVLNENASRGIAETARQIVNTNVDHDPSSSPLIVVLAGNTKTGARAIAGGRHLLNHGARVVVCVLGSEREQDLSDNVRRQLNIYQKFGGQVTSFDELWKTLKYVKAPPELIIDALLGMHTTVDDLRKDDIAVFNELLTWANDGTTDVLSIDVPSGLDASSGVTDSFIQPTYVLSLGAPKIGLVTAISRDPAYERWKLYVSDIGISNTAWKKFGTRRRHGVEFGREWVTALRYQTDA